MSEKQLIIETNVACEMAAYIGIFALAAPGDFAADRPEDLIPVLARDGFTAAEINKNLDQAMALALAV